MKIVPVEEVVTILLIFSLQSISIGLPAACLATNSSVLIIVINNSYFCGEDTLGVIFTWARLLMYIHCKNKFT